MVAVPQRDPGSCPVAGETRGATPALNDYMFSQVQQMVEGAAMMQGATYLIRKQGEAIGIDNSPALLEEIIPLAQALKLETIHTRRFGASEDAGFLIERVQRNGGQAAYLILGPIWRRLITIRNSTSTRPCWPRRGTAGVLAAGPPRPLANSRKQTRQPAGCLVCFTPCTARGLLHLLSQHDGREVGEVVDLVGRLARTILASRVVPAGCQPLRRGAGDIGLGVVPTISTRAGSGRCISSRACWKMAAAGLVTCTSSEITSGSNHSFQPSLSRHALRQAETVGDDPHLHLALQHLQGLHHPPMACSGR